MDNLAKALANVIVAAIAAAAIIALVKLCAWLLFL